MYLVKLINVIHYFKGIKVCIRYITFQLAAQTLLKSF